MQFSAQQLSTPVLNHHDREQARCEAVDTISPRHDTLVFVLNRAKWFKQVCWNSLAVVTPIGPAIRQHARVLRDIFAMYRNGTMCNRSLKQAAISLSSCEAEFYAASACAGELFGLAEFKELHSKVSVRLEVESDSARHILQRRGPGGIKHIEIRCLSIQQWIRDK